MNIKKIGILGSFLIIGISSYAEHKILEELNISILNSPNDYFLPLEEGEKYYNGMNYYFEEKGFINKKNIDFSYVLRQNVNDRYIKSTIHKLRAGYYSENFLLNIGKDIITIGPFEDSIILSNNSEPFFLVNVELFSKKSITNTKKWKIQLINGFLNEKRFFNSNPKLLFIRAEYGSHRWNFGITRYSMYGGSNRPSLSIWDYPKLIAGSEENNSYSKYDTDGYLSYDISLDLSDKFRNIDMFKLVFLQAATDITAPWQKEDRGKFNFPFIVKLQLNSYQAKIETKFSNHFLKLQLTSINDLFYIHHLYNPEGYSNNTFCLGYPYGRYLWDIYINYKINYKDSNIEYLLGKMKQPDRDIIRHNAVNIFPHKMIKTYFKAKYSKYYKNFKVTPFIFIEHYNNRNLSLNPILINIKKINKIYIWGGTNFSLVF